MPATLAVAAVAVPVLMARVPEIGFALQWVFALVCHQHADRSFLLFGGTFAVCARCLGIYLGAAAGLLLRVPRAIAWRVVVAALAITGIDWFAELAGVHGNWMFARFVLGMALGTAAAMMIGASATTHTSPDSGLGRSA
jgi:uncharacterized membrane protein